MKKIFTLTLVFLLMGSLATALVGCGQQKTESSNVIKYGMDASYKPFEFRDEQNKIVGFDVDIMNALAKEMGMKAEAVDTAWDGIIPALLNGKFDVAATAMTITAERAKSVDFTKPYFKSGQVVVVRTDETAVTKPDQLAGHVIGVQINSTGDIAATEKIKDAKEIKRYNTAPDIFVGLANKEIDAVVVDAGVAFEYNKANPGKVNILKDYLTTEDFGLAVKKGNKETLDKLNKALDTIKSNGEYDKIYQKWFGKEN